MESLMRFLPSVEMTKNLKLRIKNIQSFTKISVPQNGILLTYKKTFVKV